MKSKRGLYFFLLFLNILGGVLATEWLAIMTKPLLMPVLIWIVWMESPSKKLKIVLTLALLFSLMGDVLLMVARDSFFIYGLAAFLLAHLAYIFIFKESYVFKPLRLFPVLGFIALFCFGVLWDKLPSDMTIPVYAYMTVIAIMGITASMRSCSNESYEWVLIGAILFIISDSFIAVDQFVNKVPFASFWIMSTYGTAQYLLVNGLLKGGQSK